jgi:rhodanese-related sulfurtransferase
MKTVRREQLKAMLDRNDDVVMVNVLDRESFTQAHIPGSFNVPAEEADFIRRVEDLAGDKDAKVIVYCGSFECPLSNTAARRLEQAGFSQIYEYEGGIEDWQEAGYPLESGVAASVS